MGRVVTSISLDFETNLLLEKLVKDNPRGWLSDQVRHMIKVKAGELNTEEELISIKQNKTSEIEGLKEEVAIIDLKLRNIEEKKRAEEEKDKLHNLEEQAQLEKERKLKREWADEVRPIPFDERPKFKDWLIIKGVSNE